MREKGIDGYGVGGERRLVWRIDTSPEKMGRRDYLQAVNWTQCNISWSDSGTGGKRKLRWKLRLSKI